MCYDIQNKKVLHKQHSENVKKRNSNRGPENRELPEDARQSEEICELTLEQLSEGRRSAAV